MRAIAVPQKILMFVFFFAFLGFFSEVAAQHTVEGTVTDAETGEALPGVNILVQGTTIGAATGSDGEYALEVPDEEAVLNVSSVGYLSQEIDVDGRTTIDIELSPDVSLLDEVVVVGYQTVSRSDLTGSVSSVDSEELTAVPSTTVEQALKGRAAGVQVQENTGHPGGSISIQIRGANSIQGDTEPLYVIDGFLARDARSLDPSNIESIEILKDASAVAIYGSRAANGVVMITTKRGREGATRVQYESRYGVQQHRNPLELMSAQEYGEYYNIVDANMGNEPRFSQEEINSWETHDWQDYMIEDAPRHSHSLNVSGGDQSTRWAVSASMNDQQGLIRNSEHTRYSINSSLEHDVSDFFGVNVNATLSRVEAARQLSSGARFGASLISGILGTPPYIPPFQEDGGYTATETFHGVSEGLYNVAARAGETSDLQKRNNILVNTALTFSITDELVLRVSGGVESQFLRGDFYQTMNYPGNPDGVASVNTQQYLSLLNENTLNYTTTIADRHQFSGVLGATAQNFRTTTLGASSRRFLSDITQTHALGTGALPGTPSTSFSENVILSGLGRINYTYDDRYLITASLRTDGSSQFSEGDKWSLFPSAALAWRISEEAFFDVDWISELKLRTSWGTSGSQAIGPYQTMNRLNSGQAVLGGSQVTTMQPGGSLASPLTWEVTEQYDIGVDASLLDGRVELAADYYVKNTTDLLNPVQLPRSTGYSSSTRNVGEVSNRGFEFSANSYVISTENFSWQMDGNISFNRSEVKTLHDGQDIQGAFIDMILFADYGNTMREGYPMNAFFGWEEDGYDDEGNIVYKEDQGKVYLGDPNPDFTYGLSSSMNYKGLGMNVYINGVQGNEIINVSKFTNTIDNTWNTNMLREVLYDHWTPDNPDAKYPAPRTGQDYRLSDRLVEDGSYLRLQNIELSYNLPVHMIGLNMQNAQIYVSGQNLITFTSYSWWDPEVNSRGDDSLAQGIDHNTYPTARSYTTGIRMTF